jgi:transcriptional regulator with XRE-family HTH domain
MVKIGLKNEFKRDIKENKSKLAVYLKTLRQDGGFSMRQLAAIIGTSHSFVVKIEQQNRRLDVGEFIEYCTALNKDPTEVLQAIIEA